MPVIALAVPVLRRIGKGFFVAPVKIVPVLRSPFFEGDTVLREGLNKRHGGLPVCI